MRSDERDGVLESQEGEDCVESNCEEGLAQVFRGEDHGVADKAERTDCDESDCENGLA